MAGVWSKLINLWEYRNTEGVQSIVPRGKNISLARDKIRKPHPTKRVYEEILLENVSEDKDHIVVSNDGVKKIVDTEVPELAKKAAYWDNVTKAVPGFTQEMLVVADLRYGVEFQLTERLNLYLEVEELSPVDHVMQAVNRYKKNDKYFVKDEKIKLRKALKNFFTLIGGSTGNICRDQLMKQWELCRTWQRRRVSVAHPLEQYGSLDEVKLKIAQDKAYAPVREIALLMADVIIQDVQE